MNCTENSVHIELVMSDLAGPVLGEVTLALRLAVGAKHKVACSHIHCYVRFARGIFDNRR